MASETRRPNLCFLLFNSRSCDSQRREELVHLAGRVAISRANGDGNARSKQGLGLLVLTQPSEQLGELKISGDIIGMLSEQLSEMRLSDVGLAVGRAAHRQAVSQKRIVRLGREKLFEFFAS